MGTTAATPANLLIGAPGIVLLNNADIGATEGNTVFRVTQNLFSPRLNGLIGVLMGTDYKQSEMAELEVGVPEVSAAAIAALMPGSVSASVGAATAVGSPVWAATTLAAAVSVGQYTAIKVAAVTGMAIGHYANFGAGTQVRQITRVGTLGAGGSGIDVSDPLSAAVASGGAVTQFNGDGGTQYTSGVLVNRRIPTSAYATVEARLFGLNGLRYVFGVRNAIKDDNAEFTLGDAALMAPRAKFQSRLDAAAFSTQSPWYLTRIPADV